MLAVQIRTVAANRRCVALLVAFATAGWIVLSTSTVVATEPTRIWVDALGQFSVEAQLQSLDGRRLKLRRQDGGEVTLQLDQLSVRDQEYIDGYRARVTAGNPLRRHKPKPPQIESQPLLKLDPAATVAPEDAVLSFDAASPGAQLRQLPGPLSTDRAALRFAVPETRIQLYDVDRYHAYSRPIPVVTTNPSGTRHVGMMMSVSRSTGLPGVPSSNRLIRFDVHDGKAYAALNHDESIRLLDHHTASGRSLVLLGHNPLGYGGALAMVTGWESGPLSISHRRRLTAHPPTKQVGQAPRVRWARWIDQQHVLAVIDQTLGMWNLVSGEQIYAIAGIDTRAEPALSGGRRYVAVPDDGGVALYATTTGQSLGRIPVEKQVPAVSFSPLGHALAIATSRRMRVWDLSAAALEGDVSCRSGLGSDPPTWVDSDLILTSSGVLVSLFRALPVWRYDLTGATAVAVGEHVVLMRKHPTHELAVLKLPHPTVTTMLNEIDTSPAAIDRDTWRIPGRSEWASGKWVEPK